LAPGPRPQTAHWPPGTTLDARPTRQRDLECTRIVESDGPPNSGKAPSSTQAGRCASAVRLRLVAVIGVGCGLVAAIAVVAVALGAQSGSRQARAAQPSSGAYGLSLRKQEEVQRYVVAVFEATREHSRACLALPPLTQRLNHGSPNAALLSILGVLRRPATPADLPELVSDGRADFPGTYVNNVRRARGAFGISYYVIPGDAGQISAGCAAAETAALRRAPARYPESTPSGGARARDELDRELGPS
jgi:hypothetical protein